jgi:hypothetical protein
MHNLSFFRMMICDIVTGTKKFGELANRLAEWIN